MALAEIYDEEFNRQLLLARTLITKLRRKGDREICTKWLTKLVELDSCDPIVKKNRNHFFKYMLTVILKGTAEKPHHYNNAPNYNDRFGNIENTLDDSGFLSRWSADKRTYVAAKPLPGKGALIYMAVAKDPSLGWETRSKSGNATSNL